jgi:hypothetical protein
MKWIGDRISFNEQKDKITLVIYPPVIGGMKYILLIWSLVWLSIGAYVFSQLFLDYSEKEKITLIIFLAFWAYFALRVGKTVVYLWLGREFIKLDEHALHIKSATGRYGKARQYFLENIVGFEMVELKDGSISAVYESSFWVKGSNRIVFEYLGKTVSFGRKLNEKDTRLLYKLLLKRMEQNIRKLQKTS